jgi:hypothetical protein
MSNPSKYNFPNAQKVQIFEQVDTYIENNNPTDPEIQATIADLKTLITDLQTNLTSPPPKFAKSSPVPNPNLTLNPIIRRS